MLKTKKLIIQSCVIAAFAVAAPMSYAHETDNNTRTTADSVGNKVENTAEKVGDKIERAAEKTGDKLKSVGNKIQDKTTDVTDADKTNAVGAVDRNSQRVGNKIENAADNAGDKMQNAGNKMQNKAGNAMNSAAGGVAANDGGKGDGERSNNLNAADKQFVIKAAQSNIAEVQISKLAQDKATSEAAKDFARKMVTDHTLATSDLKFIASQKDITLPEDTDAKHKADLAKLQKLSGAAFDKAYMDMMAKSHKEALALFQRGAKNSKDADVKGYAQRVLQKIQEHHQMVGNLKAGGSAGGAAAGGAANR